MNVRLQYLLAQAEALPDAAQDRLADVFERELRAEGVERILGPDEVAALERILSQDHEDAPEIGDEAYLALAAADGGAEFTLEELEQLDRLLQEPFVPADPERVAAFLTRRG